MFLLFYLCHSNSTIIEYFNINIRFQPQYYIMRCISYTTSYVWKKLEVPDVKYSDISSGILIKRYLFGRFSLCPEADPEGGRWRHNMNAMTVKYSDFVDQASLLDGTVMRGWILCTTIIIWIRGSSGWIAQWSHRPRKSQYICPDSKRTCQSLVSLGYTVGTASCLRISVLVNLMVNWRLVIKSQSKKYFHLKPCWWW